MPMRMYGLAPKAQQSQTTDDAQGRLWQPPLYKVILGPLVGLVLWWLPLEIDPTAHKALAIVGFMLVYWMTEAIDLGLTALMGCLLFWVLQVPSSAVAFSGFSQMAPWYIFGALLIGQAASQTGLARRVGYLVLHLVGTTYTRLLLGLITLVFVLNFLIPPSNTQVVTLAPFVIGVVAALGVGPQSNVAKGLFVMLTYGAGLFNKMFLGAGPGILAQGIIAEQTGVRVLWSQWFIAFFPLALPTIVVSWLTIRWLYPPEALALSSGKLSLQDTVGTLGPWSWQERKALFWLLLAITLWATDFLHHTSPAAIGLGIGLLLVLPKVGVLDTQALKSVNFLLILFVGGSLSMAKVLTETHVLDTFITPLLHWQAPLLSTALRASLTLYWGGFLYHFLAGSEITMVSTLLPVLLRVADVQGYNPVAVGMLWTFAGGGKLLVYQSSVFVLGYSYGFFTAKDLFKVGAILTLVQGFFLLVLVPVYWPLVGIPWRITPPRQAVEFSRPGEPVLEEQSHDRFRAPWQHARQTTSHPTMSLLGTAFTPATSSAPDSAAKAGGIGKDATRLHEVVAVYRSARGKGMFEPLHGFDLPGRTNREHAKNGRQS
jgi:anion transporter